MNRLELATTPSDPRIDLFYVRRIRGLVNTMTRKAYVPVAKKSLLWLLLFATIYPVILVVGIDLMPGISRLAAASKSATSFLESSWGPVPNPETRLGRRNFVGACGIIDAAVLVVLMAVAAALSNAMGADWLKWVAVVPVIPAGLAVGAGMVLGFRGGVAAGDALDWERAGKPIVWEYRTTTQPGTTDLVLICALAAVSWAILLGALFGAGKA